jgi:hypothetical protein
MLGEKCQETRHRRYEADPDCSLLRADMAKRRGRKRPGAGCRKKPSAIDARSAHFQTLPRLRLIAIQSGKPDYTGQLRCQKPLRLRFAIIVNAVVENPLSSCCNMRVDCNQPQ